jgi:DNA polymerase zeta
MRKGSNERLEIDSNSRQFIAVGKESGHSADHDHVEEVKWEPSQKLSMTQSQVSQDEGIGRIPDERTHTAGPWPESQQESADPLDGIGAQGGRIHVHGGGALKAKTRSTQPSAAVLEGTDAMGRSNFFSTPVTIMSVEIHVQCREGESRLGSRKKIPMTPDSNKDKISAIVFVFARDPGGGEDLKVLSRGCILTTLEGENPRKESSINMKMQQQLQRSVSRSSFGVVCPFKIEVVKDERQILLRFKDIIRKTDPDILLSWDMQGAGVGYIIERGVALGRSSSQVDSSIGGATVSTSIDMVKLLGRTPTDKRFSHCIESNLVEKMNVNSEHGGGEPDDAKAKDWVGSGLGSDWDDKVGPGAAAASIIGRLAFSAWKTISEEVKHGNASYQPAIVAAVLGRRIPHFNDLTLTKWFASKTERRKVLDHRLDQATASLLLFTDALDIIGRAGEAARLSGVTFAESFPGVRGSQYKVEGVLLRALQSLRSDERGDKNGRRSRSGASSQHSLVSSGASSTGNSKSQTQSPWKLRRQSNYFGNCDEEGVPVQEDRQYFFFSPSLEDTNQQEALEVQALTLEPKSGYYTDPVIVCDFTALYPSLIIAYNLCYSTCAGRLEYHSTRREMRKGGKTRERVGPFHYPEEKTATILQHHMKSLSSQRVGEHDSSLDDCIFYNDRAYISPTGAIYLSESVVKGVLPQVLDEMLTTRAMLKRAMKELKKSTRPVPSAVFRQLEARQLALKYVANVTYGYTSATFSGRCAMPTLADTIVELARRTLRNAIDVANRWGQGTDPWGKKDHRWLGARVIYGDTDSLFVRLPKKSHKVAFEFGELLCAAVTSLNPPPVQLKLEKVYRGCIMQTMKRYGGMKYESKDQKKPIFEAKGLETVRRDQCRLTQEILKNSLIMLFRHGIQEVREYLERQWSMILRDELPVSYFILTGRVRSQYRGGREGPVQAVLSRRLAEADPGLIVRHGQRVPYVIAAIPGKNFTLKDCVLTPMEMLEGWDAYKINARYYIVKLVNAALNRCLKLAPHYVDVNDWYQSCPKPRRRVHIWPVKSNASMITSFFGFDICSLCQQKCYADGSKQVVVCDYCRRDPAKSILLASTRLSQVEQAAHRVAKECSKCNGCFESSDTYAVVQNIAKDNTSSNSGDHQQQHHYHQRVLVRTKDRRKVEQTMLLPLANCNCIDCPNTFRRHRLREQGIEASEVFDLLTSY